MKLTPSFSTVARNRLKLFFEKRKTLQVNQRLYINTILVFLIFFIVNSVIGRESSRGLFYIFIMFWIAAIAYDIVSLYKKIYESILGKTFLAILLSLCTNFSIAYSNQLVNLITGADPSKFPRTVSLLTILSIPALATICFMGLYFLLLVLLPFILLFHLRSEVENEIMFPGYTTNTNMQYKVVTRAVQIMSLLLFCNLSFDMGIRNSRQYEIKLKNIASSFLFTMEMYQKGPCNLRSGTKMAFLGHGLILVGEKSPNGYAFEVHNCKRNNEPATAGVENKTPQLHKD